MDHKDEQWLIAGSSLLIFIVFFVFSEETFGFLFKVTPYIIRLSIIGGIIYLIYRWFKNKKKQ